MSDDIDTITLASELTIAWLGNSNNRITADDVPAFLSSMHDALGKLSSPAEEPAAESPEEYTPAVSVRKSLASRDHIISLIDGKPYKTLKRHLGSQGLTPDEYRKRYGLKADYPMVAPNYSDTRRETAARIGLGRKREKPEDGAFPSPAESGEHAPGKPARKTRASSAKAPPEAPAPTKSRKRASASDAKAAAKAHLEGAADS